MRRRATTGGTPASHRSCANIRRWPWARTATHAGGQDRHEHRRRRRAVGRRRQGQDRGPAGASGSRSWRGTRAGTTPATPSTSGGRKFILRLIPSGILHPGVTCVIGNGVVVDLKALFDEVDELADGRDRRRRPPARVRSRARHPAVPPRPRPAERGEPRRAEDRHHLARHRAGLRGQGRPAGPARVRPG